MEYWNALGAIGTIATAIIALHAINREKERSREEIKCNEAKECLKLSYDALLKDSIDGAPIPHRQNWMTSARFIIRFYEIKSDVQQDEYKKILDGQRLVWLYVFYESLRKIGGGVDDGRRKMLDIPAEYFLGNGVALEQTSVAVVLNFAIWDDEINDPLGRSGLTMDKLARVLEVCPSTKKFLERNRVFRN